MKILHALLLAALTAAVVFAGLQLLRLNEHVAALRVFLEG